MTGRARGGLTVLLFAALAAAPAAADVEDALYDLQVISPIDGLEPGQPAPLEILLRAAKDLELAGVALDGRGWRVVGADIGDKAVPARGEATLRFTVTPSADWEPLQLRFTVDGRPQSHTLDLAPLEVRRQRFEGALTRGEKAGWSGPPRGYLEDEPGMRPGPVSLSRLPEHLRGGDKAAAFAAASPTRTITNTGGVGFYRDGEFHGVFGVTVVVYWNTGVVQIPLGQTTTNRSGSFFLAFDAPDGIPLNLDIVVVAANDAMRVMVESLVFEDVYYWNGLKENGFTGTSLDWGWLGCEGHVGAQNIVSATSRANVLLYTNTGLSGIDWVDIWWPIYEGSSHYTRVGTFNPVPDIYIRDTSTWYNDVHCHEYGHHFVNTYAQSPLPDYCNPGGYCDSGDCGHCAWCAENANIAYTEGFPHWLGYQVWWDWVHEHTGTMPTGHKSTYKRASACLDGTFTDPWLTEGAFAALLFDMVSDLPDDDPHYPGWVDEMTAPYSHILDTVMFDEPISPWQFIHDFRARHPSYDEEFWQVCMNNGFFGLDTTAPTVGTVTSPSHPVGVDRPSANVTVDIAGYADDFSGLAGFAVRVNPGSPASPGYAINAQAPRTVMGPYPAGSYYVTVRAFDKAENYTSGYVTYGPIIIREPIAADLAPDPWTADWPYPLIPRRAPVADGRVIPAETQMISQASTYWNACIVNTGEVSTPNQRSVVLVDGIEAAHYDGWLPGWGDHLTVYNQGPITVPGGRHVFELGADFYESVAETDETDNRWGKQWIWWPTTMNAGYSYNSDGAPLRTAGWDNMVGTSWFNADGYRVVTATGVAPNQWMAVWVRGSHRTRDVDVRVHDVATGAESGFAANLGASYRPAGYLDAVLVNANNRPAAIYDVGIMTGATEDAPVGYRTAVSYGGELAENVALAATLPSQYGLALHTFPAAPGAAYTVTLERAPLDFDEPLRLSWYAHDFVTGDLLDHDAVAVLDSTNSVSLTFTAANTTTADHALAVWRDQFDNSYVSQDYTITIRRAPADLVPDARPGWAGPVVPRNAADATETWAPEPTVLVGDQSGTYFNYCFVNGGLGASAACQVSHRVDGLANLLFYHGGLDAGAFDGYLSPVGFPVPGGRHAVALEADLTDMVDESDETNNGFVTQYVWRPSNLVYDSLMNRAEPPPPTADWDLGRVSGTLWYNCDAKRTPTFKPSGTSAYWGAVAAVPGPNSDIDLRLHYWSTGARDGFAAPLATSAWSQGQSDFLIMNFRATMLRYYDVGIVRAGPATGEAYDITVVRSTGLPANPDGVVGTWTMAATDLIKLYEVNFTVTGRYRATLSTANPAADLGFSLYGPDLVLGGKSDCKDGTAAAWTAVGGDDSFEFDVPAGSTGLHGLAVWKVGAADVPLATDFTLTIDLIGVSGVEPATPPSATRLVGAYPNPFNPRTTVVFELDRSAAADLRIYDVSGRLVRTLVAGGTLHAGRHEVAWDGRDRSGRQVAAGVYFCRFASGRTVQTQRMSLVK